MQPRFVIVPALPIQGDSFQIGNRFYAAATSGGFDIYDNQEKERLKRGFTKRTAAAECEELNAGSRNPAERFPLERTE